MSKHTPGPWEFIAEDNAVVAHPAEYDLVVAMVYAPVRDLALDRDNGSHEGNARLIAAAPDMVDALRDASECIRGMFPNIHPMAFETVAKITSALNKAGLGES